MLSIKSNKVPLVLQNPLSNHVTSLPYIDQDLNESQKQHVNSLIKNEMDQMEQKDYLESMPFPETKILENNFYKDIYKLNEQGQQSDFIDFQNYENIKNMPKTVNQLESSIEKLNMLRQNQNFQKINLELQSNLGQYSWQNYLSNNDLEVENLKKIENNLRFQNNEVNSKRKFEQFQQLDKMNLQVQQIKDQIEKNIIINRECCQLEEEIREIALKKMKLN